MILVFGGTTEGRRAAEVLEEAGNAYYYSTKTGEQDITLHHGQRIDGALDEKAMQTFCSEHDIRLIVDAAHPFASVLHQTIASFARAQNLPVIRYERIYPPRDPDITWIDDYSKVPIDIKTLLATTGVQSICKLQYLEAQGIKVYYRILNRESSITLARKLGATDEQLCFYEDASEISIKADAILLKESGETGGFSEKVAAARAKGMRIIALKRPSLSIVHYPLSIVDGPYGLRRAVEKLLPEFFPLHSGLTTGTCATAAAVAATMQLIHSSDTNPDSSLFLHSKRSLFGSSDYTLHSSLPFEVPVALPNGETIAVPVGYGEGYAYCIKEAGDDPDVTDGIEIRAYPYPLPKGGEPILIEGGEGIGRFTLPGFDFPPGEPAINRVPREMILRNLKELYEHSELPSRGEGLGVGLSVPNGEEIARRTFNPRLGIEGGISIIGVSGIVKPYSEEAFIQSIHKCMEVAKASGSERVVIGSGMKSEQQLRALYPKLPQQAFVEYGNYIGETLKMADEMGIPHVTLGIMIGKAVKLAQGHLDTHSRRVVMDKDFIQQMLDEAHCQLSIVHYPLATARELWNLLSPDDANRFSDVVVRHCYEHSSPLLPNGELTILLLRNN